MLRLNNYAKGGLIAAFLILSFVFIIVQIGAANIPFGLRNTITNTLSGAYSVHLADMDGDGDQDVIASASSDGEIAWWENTNGDGSAWSKHAIDSTVPDVGMVHAADIDGDGDLDVIGAAFGSSDIVSWWENLSGDGASWIEHNVKSNYDGAVGVTTADLDQDGDMDILSTAWDDDQFTWWDNEFGDGTVWLIHTISDGILDAYFVETADVDSDGDLDILGAGPNSNQIVWWENNLGDGSTFILHSIDISFASPRMIRGADIDQDGDIDITAVAYEDDEISWWENLNGDGSSWAKQIVSQNINGAYAVFVEDLDMDGDLDLVGTGQLGNEVVWFENLNGEGTSWLAFEVDLNFDGAQQVVVGDIDSDGDNDLAAVAVSGDELAWWENETIHRNALFPDNIDVATGFDGANSVIDADLDGDGDLDILGTAVDGDMLSWFENIDGNGFSWISHSIADNFDGALDVDVVDIDSDGDLDVLGAAQYDNEISWWENTSGDGSIWSKTIIVSNFDTAISVKAADIDGDGDQDVVGAAREGDEVGWWENTAGDGSAWQMHPVDSAIESIHQIHPVDLDRDGDRDIVGITGEINNNVVWWENMVGDGSIWSKIPIENNFLGGVVIDPVDMDRDGDVDILGGAHSANDVMWWENTSGDGTVWFPHIVDEDFMGVREVFAFDIDLDGDFDIVGAAEDSDEIVWWENTTGDGSTWLKSILSNSFMDAWSVHAGDIDSDGDLDILGAAGLDDEIKWWENCGGQFGLAVTDTAPITMVPLDVDDLARVSAVHNGRTGDHNIELTAFDILLEEADGDPLTTAEANALIENLSIYLDDGSGVFEVISDTLVTTVGDLSLTNGVQTVPFGDGDVNVQISYDDGSRDYFVVVEIAADPTSNPDWNNIETLDLTLLHETSTAEDMDQDLPLTQDCRTDVTAGVNIQISVPTPTPTSTSTPSPTMTPTETPAFTPEPTSTSTPKPTSTPTPTPESNSDNYVFIPVIYKNPGPQ